jgi:hypothetical protein
VNASKRGFFQKAKKIIAIGDLHGDYGKLVFLLELSRLIDKRRRWIGGDTILVQTVFL